MPTLKEFSGNAPITRLSAQLPAATVTSFVVATNGGAGYPTGATAPFVVVIDKGTALEEKILVNTRSSDTFGSGGTGLTRGYDSTVAQDHEAQATVEHVIDAVTMSELSQHMNNVPADPHSMYQTEAGLSAAHALLSHATAMLADGAVTTVKIADANVTGAKIEEAQRWLPGDLKMTARATAATGWLLCDGAAVSRTTYADLFTAIGVLYGAGNGSTTFNLPDLRQRFPMGKAASGTGSTLGATGGSNNAVAVSHNHTQDAHSHTQNAHGHTQNGHTHAFQDPTHRHGPSGNQFVRTITSSSWRLCSSSSPYSIQSVEGLDFTTYEGTGAFNSDAKATNQSETATNQSATATNQATGSSATDANLPQYQVVNYEIKI